MSLNPREYFIQLIISSMPTAHGHAASLPNASEADRKAIVGLRTECEELLREKLKELERLDVHRTAQRWLRGMDGPNDE